MVEWQTGMPAKPSWYVVAITYRNGMGTIGCAMWDSEGWRVDKGDNVTAYIPLDNVLKQAKITWPDD